MTRSLLPLPLAAVLAVLSACTAGTEPVENAAAPERSTSAPPDLLPDDGTVPAPDPPRPTEVDAAEGADVVVTLAQWDGATGSVLVGGYVSPVIEEGGTCTVELEQAGRVVRSAAPGMPDATTTVCGGLDVDGAELGPGTWTLVLRYESPSVAGESAPVDVEVAA